MLNFRAPDNRIVKVWFTISSKAFPITDATKVTASGIGGCVSVSGKTLTITYERSMNRGEIELDFAEGALMEGASIASSTTFDFTESLTRQLKVEMDGKERIYNVRIDYSKVMEQPIVYGFSEVTAIMSTSSSIRSSMSIRQLRSTAYPYAVRQHPKPHGAGIPVPVTWTFTLPLIGNWAATARPKRSRESNSPSPRSTLTRRKPIWSATMPARWSWTTWPRWSHSPG